MKEFLSATETKFSYPLLLVQSIVSVLKIIANFIFVQFYRKVLFLAAEIDYLEQDFVWALEPGFRTL